MLSSTGTAEFLVAADARFWLGSRRLPVGQLRTHTGAQVTVAWSEVDGVRTTHTVRASESRAAQGSLTRASRMSVAVCAMAVAASRASAAPTEAFDLRGVGQTLHLYGPPGGGPPSWPAATEAGSTLAPQIAEVLALEGYPRDRPGLEGVPVVVHLRARDRCARDEVRARLRGPGHCCASREGHGRPLLFGISEGAGLSVLAATDPRVRDRIAGVVALGLPDLNELGWRWRDSIIYVTKKTPDEPTFSVLEVVDRIRARCRWPPSIRCVTSSSPWTRSRAIVASAREPKRLWLVDAADHRFSGAPEDLRRSLLEAVAWAEAHAPAAH